MKKLYRSEILLSDKAFNVAGLRDEYETAYFLESGGSNRILPYLNKIQNSITFEMSLNKRKFYRQVYSFLDMLGDVGGLFGAMCPFCAILVSIF